MKEAVPDVVVQRVPMYAHILRALKDVGIESIGSRELGAMLRTTPAQIRKDLSYFGKFGKQGMGYDVSQLLDELTHVLGLGRKWSLALVGTGRLGRALIEHKGFIDEDFQMVAVFDKNPRRIGKKLGGIVIQDVAELEQTVKERDIEIGIVAVPPAETQRVIDALVRAGTRAILNYAPIVARVPKGVQLRQITPLHSLQSMTYYLKSEYVAPAPVAEQRTRKKTRGSES
jgi:redox-sensing transcriptional repressor